MIDEFTFVDEAVPHRCASNPSATRTSTSRWPMPNRVPLGALFAIYLVLLTWIVLWKLHAPYTGYLSRGTIKVVPFAAAEGFGANDPGELIGNLLLFVPFGTYLKMLAPHWPWWRHVGVFVLASVAFEFCQFVLSVGSADTTDVLMNTAGGVLGLILASPFARRRHAISTTVVTWACAVGTVIAVIGAGGVIASFPNSPPLHSTSGLVSSARPGIGG